MAKYGAGKYGAGKYGSSAVAEEGEVTHVLMIDWDNDGIFDGTNEADRLIDLRMMRGNKHFLSTSGIGFAPMRGGKAVLTLDNYDRRYDPRYTSSPLYPNVGPGKEVYIRVINNSDQTNYDILKGVIADIRPLSGPGGGDKVRIIVNDGMQEIWNATCTESASKLMMSLMGSFYEVLYDIYYKGPVQIDQDTQPVPSLDIDDKNAGTIVNQLAAAGLGVFFVDRFGVARYYGRNHSGYTNHSIDEGVVLKQILVSQPWDAVYNHVNVVVHRPIWKQPSVIYSLPNPEAINTGTNVTIRCKYRLSKDIQLGELEANTEKDGNGTDITDDITVVSEEFGQSGGTVVLSTSTNGYITRLEVEGRMLGDLREDSVHTDDTSIADYGLKKLKIDSPYMQDPHFATVFSEAIKDVTKDSREAITIEVRQRPSVQYPIDIMHSVAFTAGTLTLDDTYYITGYEHRWNNDTGQDVTTTVWLHKIITDSTSITASEIETENYVPPQLENPSETPWLPPPEPPGEGEPGASAGYVFIPALGGSDAENADNLVYGGQKQWNRGGGDYYGVYGAGVLLHCPDCGTYPQYAWAYGAYFIPSGVTSISITPILHWGGYFAFEPSIEWFTSVQLRDSSGEIIVIDDVVSFYVYSSQPTLPNTLHFATGLTLTNPVSPGNFLALKFGFASGKIAQTGNEDVSIFGWKAILS